MLTHPPADRLPYIPEAPGAPNAAAAARVMTIGRRKSSLGGGRHDGRLLAIHCTDFVPGITGGPGGGDPRDTVFEDGADGGLGEGEGVIVSEDAAQGDGLGDGAGGGEAAKAHEDAEEGFGPGGHLQPVDDADGNRGADEVREGVQAEADIAGQVCDVRGEAARFALRDQAQVPDCSHGPALDDEEQDLGAVAEAGEHEKGPDEDSKRRGRAAADAEDVEDLGEDGVVDRDRNLRRRKAFGEKAHGDNGGNLGRKAVVSGTGFVGLLDKGGKGEGKERPEMTNKTGQDDPIVCVHPIAVVMPGKEPEADRDDRQA
ncbi:MAG: hypothetical protein Q9163_004518 [Psora crenata]